MGVGGVGGYFGGKLAHAFSSNANPSVNVFFIARGQHLETIKQNGLVLKSPEFKRIRCRPRLAAESLSELPPIDLFLIAVKGYDLTEIATSMRDYIKEHTIVLPLLNGADTRERLRTQMKTGIILPTCVYISAHIEEPGVVAHIGKPGKMIFGRDPDHPDYIPHEIFKVFEKASIDFEWKDDAQPAIWAKYLFIASFGLISARYDRTLGEILEEPLLKEGVIGIMNEVYSIALKKNIRLSDEIVDLSLKKAAMFPRDTQTSLQRDIHQKKGKSELELFGGTIVNLGEKLGIPTPTTKRIYGELGGACSLQYL
jgi:2-dehydropantoate 2-reductase